MPIKMPVPLIILITLLCLQPFPVFADPYVPYVKIVKKPAGWKVTPGEYHKDWTINDRAMWRSVLKWCDECEERAKPFVEDEYKYRGIYVLPFGENEYIVGVYCDMTMRQSEHLIYKVKENPDTIESRLLKLEQFDFIAKNRWRDDHIYGEHREKGRFIRFADSLIYGWGRVDKEKKHLIVYHEYQGCGGCGLQTTYNVNGNVPKVIDFRANTYCSARYVPPEKWRVYPAKERAKWRTATNPLRENWNDKNTCR